MALLFDASPSEAEAPPAVRVVGLPLTPPRYGEPPPSWLGARGFVPGATQRLALVATGRVPEPGGSWRLTLRDVPRQRSVVLATLRSPARRPGSDGGSSLVTAAPRSSLPLLADGDANVPAWPEGTYQLELDGPANQHFAAVPVVLSSAYATAQRAAVRALDAARTAAPRLDEVARSVSLPSVEMLVEDAEAVWNDITETERDLRFVLAQLENARAFAERLARGEDPYAGTTGILYKAYRSEIDGTLQPYGVRVPRSLAGAAAETRKSTLPLLVDLHGAWANHRLDMRRIFGRSNRPGESDHEASRNVLPLPETDMLVATAYGRGEFFGYEGLGEDDVLRVIADVRKAYPVDPERIYLTGYSMGGGGVWSIGLRHPALFAALVPVCGTVDGVSFQKRPPAMQVLDDPGVRALTSPAALAENAFGLRVIIFHGDQDPSVPVESSRLMAERFKALGYLGKNVTYHELPGVAHEAWEVAYADGRIFREVAGAKRETFPRRVRLRTYSSRYGDNAWLRIDALEKGGQHAVVDGTQDGKGSFSVTTQNVRGLTVRWDERALKPGARVNVSLDGTTAFNGVAPSPLFFERRGPLWRRVEAPALHEVPDHPAWALFGKSLPRSRAHVYVYGTAGSSEMTQASRAFAETLADFGEGTKFRGTVRADVEVREDELAQLDVVLVGGPRSNQLAARWAKSWPSGVLGTGRRDGGTTTEDAATDERDRAFRLVVPRPEAPGHLALVLGADTVTGLAHLRTWLVDDGPAPRRLPETNTDYLVLDGRGQLVKVGAFREDWVIR